MLHCRQNIDLLFLLTENVNGRPCRSCSRRRCWVSWGTRWRGSAARRSLGRGSSPAAWLCPCYASSAPLWGLQRDWAAGNMTLTDITVHTSQPQRYTVKMKASMLLQMYIWPYYDLGLCPLTLKPFSAMLTRTANIYGKFRWIPTLSTKISHHTKNFLDLAMTLTFDLWP